MKKTPYVNMVIFCYNQEKYIKESVIACLNQNYKNLHIIISDDHSTDKTLEVAEKEVKQANKHSHKVTIRKTPKNLGIGAHFAYIMENLVDGELIVMCGGDDVSEPNRVSRITEEWLKNNKPSLIAHNLNEIDENGTKIQDYRTIQYSLQDYSPHNNKKYSIQEYLKHHHPIPFLGAAVAYKRETYKKFKTPKTFPDFEDHLMFFRSQLDNGCYYFNEKLVNYRKHKDSYTRVDTKPFNDQINSALSYYFDKTHKIKPKYLDCYTSHKVSVQQWYDYIHAIRKHNYKADYQITENLWRNIVLRHRTLIKNKNLIYKIKAQTINKNLDTLFLKEKIKYLEPINAVIFGTGPAAKQIIKKAGACYKFHAACNTVDPRLYGKYIHGIKIISLDELMDIKDKIDCILIASVKYYEIKNLLKNKAKIEQNKIVRVPKSILFY